jgi:hypothetical protein
MPMRNATGYKSFGTERFPPLVIDDVPMMNSDEWSQPAGSQRKSHWDLLRRLMRFSVFPCQMSQPPSFLAKPYQWAVCEVLSNRFGGAPPPWTLLKASLGQEPSKVAVLEPIAT